MMIKHVAGPVLAGLALLTAQPVSAAISTFTSEAAFLAAVANPAIDRFDDLPLTFIPGPLLRIVGPYAYTAASAGDFYPAGTAADVWLANNTSDIPITLGGFTGGVYALGGLFFVSNINGDYVPGSITVTVAAGADTASETAVDATTASFLGFVSDAPLSSARIAAVQPAARFVWSTVNNLTLAGVGPGSGSGAAAVPEPSSWALMVAGFAVIGTGLRRRVRDVRAGWSQAI